MKGFRLPHLHLARKAPRAFTRRHAALVAGAVLLAGVPAVALAAPLSPDFTGQIFFDGGRYTGVLVASDYGPGIDSSLRSDTLGSAIHGRSDGPQGYGVDGESYHGAGVRGSSTQGTGVLAQSSSGLAVFAQSTKTAVEAIGQVAVNAHSPVSPVDPNATPAGSVGLNAKAETAVKANGKYGVDAFGTSTGVSAYSTGAGTAVLASVGGGTAQAVNAYIDGAGSIGVNSFGDAIGVRGEGKTGVLGKSATGLGGEFNGASAPIRLDPATTPGAPNTGTHKRGELYVDSAGNLFLCVADSAGNAGTWKKVVLQ